MDRPIDIKRRGYLNFFKDGVRDALIEGNADDYKKFSAYYKQGYEFGLEMYEDVKENENGV
jgi:hypothetical protein